MNIMGNVNRRHRFTAGLAALLALGLSACGGSSGSGGSGASTGVSDEEVVFGSDVPLTGPAAYVGLGWRLGMEIAVKQVNDHGGVNGRTIKVEVVDNKGTAAGGAAAARTLIDRDKVFATISGAPSTAMVGGVPIYRQQRVPLYDSVASDQPVWDPFSKYVFTGATLPTNFVAEQTAGDISDRFGAKRVAMLIADDNAQCVQGADLVTDKLDEVGVGVVAKETFTSGATDFSAQIQKIKGANPDLTYLCTLAGDAPKYLPAMANAGVPGTLLGASTLGDVNVLKAAGADADGLYTYLINAFDVNETSGAMGELAKLVKAHPDAKNYNLFTLMAYADTFVALQGLANAGDDPTREGFIAGLEELDDYVAGEDGDFDYALPIGRPRSFTADDHIGNKAQTLVQLENGAFAPVAP